MSSEYEYNKYVVGGGHFRRGMIDVLGVEHTSHNPKKWNMRRFAMSGTAVFWEVGYIHRGTLAYQSNPVDTSPSFFFPRTSPPLPLWWCRDGDWLPFWGESTRLHAALTKEVRGYWINKWFGSQIPQIKQSIKESTNLPEDIIEDLSDYFEYPYQIKKLITPFGGGGNSTV